MFSLNYKAFVINCVELLCLLNQRAFNGEGLKESCETARSSVVAV